MAKKLDKASRAALAEFKAYDGGRGPEPNWEAGTLGTFRHFVLERAKAERVALPDEVLERIAEEVHHERTAEGGMAAQVDDLGYQPWLADSLAIAMRHALKSKSPQNSARPNRALLLSQIDTLCLTLQENISAVEQRRNHPPSLDLALEDNPTFLGEVKRLNKLLRQTKKALTQRKSDKGPTLATKALDKFVTNLAGSVGDGLGRTVTLTTRLILIVMAISILNGLGVQVAPILSSIRGLVPE